MKSSLGKLAIALPLDEFFERNVDGNGFRVLPITRAHLQTVYTLPFHHRDPFDRLLIAQSITESMTFVTDDAQITAYSIACLWD